MYTDETAASRPTGLRHHGLRLAVPLGQPHLKYTFMVYFPGVQCCYLYMEVSIQELSRDKTSGDVDGTEELQWAFIPRWS